MVILVVKKGAGAGASYDVTGELVLGREKADVQLDDDQVSRRHAVVRPVDDGVEVEDLGSTNGTFVDELRITEVTRIAAGGTLRVGNTVLAVERVATTTIAPSVQQTTASSPPTQAPPAPVADPSPTPVAPAPTSAPPPTPAPTPPPAPAPVPVAAPPQVPAAPAAPPPPPAAPPAPPPGYVPAAAPAPSTFAPPAAPRGRGVATRQLKATILTFTAVIVTAVALLIYFAVRATG